MKNIYRFVVIASFIQAGLAYAAWPLTYDTTSDPVDDTNSGQISLGEDQEWQYLQWNETLWSEGTRAEITSELKCDDLTPIGVMDFDETKDHSITSWCVQEYWDDRPPENQTGATFDVYYEVYGSHWQSVHPYVVSSGDNTCGYGIYAYAKPKFRGSATGQTPNYSDGGTPIAFSGEYYKPGISITGIEQVINGWPTHTINRNAPIDVNDIVLYPTSLQSQWDLGTNPTIAWDYDDGSNMSGIYNQLELHWEILYDGTGQTDGSIIYLFNEQTAKTQERIDLSMEGYVNFSASAISYNLIDFYVYLQNIVNK